MSTVIAAHCHYSNGREETEPEGAHSPIFAQDSGEEATSSESTASYKECACSWELQTASPSVRGAEGEHAVSNGASLRHGNRPAHGYPPQHAGQLGRRRVVGARGQEPPFWENSSSFAENRTRRGLSFHVYLNQGSHCQVPGMGRCMAAVVGRPVQGNSLELVGALGVSHHSPVSLKTAAPWDLWPAPK